MRIRSARITSFRNIEYAELLFAPTLTALVASNGQGKTNLLEALYVVAALRPLRSVPRSQLLRHGAARAEVALSVESERDGLVRTLEIELRPGARLLKRDEKLVAAERFLGSLVAVAFTPDDLALTKGPPELRRRFLDRALLNGQPAFLETALRYQRALKARARVLAQEGADSLLDAYDEVLAQEGAKIVVARTRYLLDFAPRFLSHWAAIASPCPLVTLRYRASLEGPLDDVAGCAGRLQEALAQRRVSDRRRRLTSVGPHVDDLEVSLDRAPAKLRASQGQHRALVLALKLAEIDGLGETLGEPPVLLLDDISSELDQDRTRQLFERLEQIRAQVVLSTTDPEQVPRRHEGAARVYGVSGGSFALSSGGAA